jgi:hypothetical protein
MKIGPNFTYLENGSCGSSCTPNVGLYPDPIENKC